MKKALALVLCAAMTFGMLTGCGSKEAATEETAAATEETGEAEASETEDAATEEAAETAKDFEKIFKKIYSYTFHASY